MIGKITDAEDFTNGQPLKLIVLKAIRHEAAVIKALQRSSVRTLRISFDSSRPGEMRLVLPPEIGGLIR